jgi:hypothetical protein
MPTAILSDQVASKIRKSARALVGAVDQKPTDEIGFAGITTDKTTGIGATRGTVHSRAGAALLNAIGYGSSPGRYGNERKRKQNAENEVLHHQKTLSPPDECQDISAKFLQKFCP